MMMPGYSLYNHKKCKYKHTNTQLQTHKYTSTFIQVQISNIHTPKHEYICGKHEPLWSHRDAQAQRRVHTAAIFRLGALQNIYGAEPTSNVHGFCIFNPKLMYHPLIIQMAIVFVNKKLEVVSYPLIMILQLMDYRHIMLITILMANVHICNFKYFVLISKLFLQLHISCPLPVNTDDNRVFDLRTSSQRRYRDWRTIY